MQTIFRRKHIVHSTEIGWFLSSLLPRAQRSSARAQRSGARIHFFAAIDLQLYFRSDSRVRTWQLEQEHEQEQEHEHEHEHEQERMR